MANKNPRAKPVQPASQEEQEFIFRPWITLRDGRRIYAKDTGKVAFRIPRRY